jgi:predicted GIY-YIG superfamily endonuclease
VNTATRQKPHVVYLHLGTDGAVLYVGTTSNLSNRNTMHRRKSAHWPLVAGVATDSIQPTFAAGRLREAVLIEKHDPPYNTHRPWIAQWYSIRCGEGITAEEEAECAEWLSGVSAEETYERLIYGPRGSLVKP